MDLETQLAEKENHITQIRENLKEQDKSVDEKEDDSGESVPERLQGNSIDLVCYPLGEGVSCIGKDQSQPMAPSV